MSDVCSSDLRARPDIPVDAQRRAADLVARIQSGIEVGETVIGIVARKRIALRGGERGELAVQRPLRLAGADEDRAAAHRLLPVPVAGERDVEIVGRPPEHLAADTALVLALEIAVGRSAASSGGEGGWS